jgi:hypothetical protein
MQKPSAEAFGLISVGQFSAQQKRLNLDADFDRARNNPCVTAGLDHR